MSAAGEELAVYLQVTAVLLRPARDDEVVVGFDLEVLPLVLVLREEETIAGRT